MDKLWAPWRIGYISKTLKGKNGNLFVNMLKQKKDKENYIIVRRKHSFAVLNIYPYNNGHVLVVSNRKVDDISMLTKAERDDLMDLLIEIKSLLDETLEPAGYNIGMNLGRVAGAGIPEHLHIHVVPRWKGDINFMPVVADTKVISQSLDTLYDKLVDAHQRRNRRTRK